MGNCVGFLYIKRYNVSNYKCYKITWGLNCMVFRTNSTSCPRSFFSIMATRKRRSFMAMMKMFVYSENKGNLGYILIWIYLNIEKIKPFEFKLSNLSMNNNRINFEIVWICLVSKWFRTSLYIMNFGWN